jgi:hypothetical protein
VNALYAGPYGILVSNVDFGEASLPYGQSGSAPKVSSFFTFWNVKVRARDRPAAVASACISCNSCASIPVASTPMHGQPRTLTAEPCCCVCGPQSNRPLTQPRAMYGPLMTWIGTRLAPWTGLNATYVQSSQATAAWKYTCRPSMPPALQ